MEARLARILTITNWYPPHHFGGYELSCWDVMRRFVDRGHDVLVLCSDEVVQGAPAPVVAHEARVRRDLVMYHRGGELWQPGARECLAVERHNHAALRRALDDHRPDVVSVWHLAGLSHGLLQTIVEAGIPIVYSVCDDWLLYGGRMDAWACRFDGSPWRRAAGRVVARVTGVPTVLPDLGDTGPVLFVTDDTRRRAEEGAPWRFTRTAVMHSGIDTATFALPGPAGDRPWGWRLASLGRFDRRKGFETAIRALPLLPEATLALWGRGGEDEQRRLAGVAERLGVAERVRFGTLERDELAGAYAAADVVLFPSEWAEPFGLVPIEAMACATPVVATGVGGSSEFLHHGRNCLLHAAGDPDALAASVRRLAGDPQLRRRLVAGGRETAAAYDVDRLADIMENWHRHVADHAAGPGPGDRPDLRLPVRPAARAAVSRRGATLVVGPLGAAGGAGEVVAEADRLPIRSGALAEGDVDLVGLAVAAEAVTAELRTTLAAPATVTLTAPGADDLRRPGERLRHWWVGDHRPVAKQVSAVPADWQPPGWETWACAPVPWRPGRRAAAVARALRFAPLAARSPALRFTLRGR